MATVAAVVNLLTFKDTVDPDLFARAERDLTPAMRAVPGFQDFHAIQVSPTEVVLIILGEDVDVLERLATEIGSPWMVANVVPLLAGPPNRQIGPTIATSARRA